MKKIFDYLLFIDDDKATNFYHNYVVDHSGLVEEQKFFSSAKEALSYFGKIERGELSKIPEVIFLDINMPEINGWEFLNLFENVKLPNAPKIVVMTTSVSPADREKAETNPMVLEFHNKPLTADYLKDLKQKIAAVKEG